MSMSHSRFSGSGYMLNDNRCSGGKVEEADVLGCKHCCAVIFKASWVEEGAYCHQCDGPICTACDRDPNCKNFMRQLDQANDEAYRREQNAKILGI